MRDTISTKLLHTLQKGKDRLTGEALRRMSDFVVSQRTAEHAFMNKSGKADLYYTSFGRILSYLLGIKLDLKKTARYLEQFDPENLDLIHYAAYIRCRMLKQLMEGGKTGLWLRSLFATKVKDLNTFNGLPHNDLHSPYTRFIWLSLLEDMGHRIKNIPGVRDGLAAYRLNDGGYRNTTHGSAATTNATVAALAVIGQCEGYNDEPDIFYLRDLQEPSGGFKAAKASPVPDMLSTATSLFMLSCYNVQPRYPAEDFIEAHWLEQGGFSATLLEDKSDVEYTFYGLLALGAIHIWKGK